MMIKTNFDTGVHELCIGKNLIFRTIKQKGWASRLSFFIPSNLYSNLASDFEEFISTDTSPEWKHSLADKLQAYEEQVIRKALEECDWNKSRAARLLKISETNIRFRMQKLNITKTD